jgi:hypothetical protein
MGAVEVLEEQKVVRESLFARLNGTRGAAETLHLGVNFSAPDEN